MRNTKFVWGGYKNSLTSCRSYLDVEAILKQQHSKNSGEFLTSLVFSVPLRGDKANGVHRGMNFIRPVKDIEAMEIEV